MTKNGMLYDKLVDITEDYLGPAAERFIDRQIENHLQKDPSQLTKKDLAKLAEWIRLSVAILTDDEEVIDGYSLKLQKLTISNGSSEIVSKS